MGSTVESEMVTVGVLILRSAEIVPRGVRGFPARYVWRYRAREYERRWIGVGFPSIRRASTTTTGCGRARMMPTRYLSLGLSLGLGLSLSLNLSLSGDESEKAFPETSSADSDGAAEV